MSPAIGRTYRKRWVTRKVLGFRAGYYWCLDTFSDGTKRVANPQAWQLERWLRGAVEL